MGGGTHGLPPTKARASSISSAQRAGWCSSIRTHSRKVLPAGANGFAVAGRDQLLYALGREFDDQVAGAVVARGEERARHAQAGETHHRAGRHAAAGQGCGADPCEEVGGPLSHLSFLPSLGPPPRPLGRAAGSRWRPASGATRSSGPSVTTWPSARPSSPVGRRRRPSGPGTQRWCAPPAPLQAPHRVPGVAGPRRSAGVVGPFVDHELELAVVEGVDALDVADVEVLPYRAVGGGVGQKAHPPTGAGHEAPRRGPGRGRVRV